MLDEERQTVRSADGSLAYTVFDKCAVRVEVGGWRPALVGGEGMGHDMLCVQGALRLGVDTCGGGHL